MEEEEGKAKVRKRCVYVCACLWGRSVEGNVRLGAGEVCRASQARSVQARLCSRVGQQS